VEKAGSGFGHFTDYEREARRIVAGGERNRGVELGSKHAALSHPVSVRYEFVVLSERRRVWAVSSCVCEVAGEGLELAEA